MRLGEMKVGMNLLPYLVVRVKRT